MVRHGFVETARAVGKVAGEMEGRDFETEWRNFMVLEVDQVVCEDAARLALKHDLRSADAIHLAAAMKLPRRDLVFSTWDLRLGEAATREGLETLPRI
jgi:predicted nucleic acid-binding protein